MQFKTNVRARIVMIGFGIILLAATVYIIGTTLRKNSQDVVLGELGNNGSPSRPVGVEEFEESANFSASMGEIEGVDNGRSLTDYYNRRAYQGAPPTVPHPVDPQSFGGDDCTQCHATGDYVPQLEAYAPIVPHPELLSCNQCHVPVVSTELFVETDWQTLAPPTLGDTVLIDSPPPIPHALQLREDCASCHAGPAAPEEIRVTHPERESCTQCHVLIETGEEWQR